jgi:ketosteroid isomerase-like protein
MPHPNEEVIRRFADAMVARDVQLPVRRIPRPAAGPDPPVQSWEEAFGGLEIRVHDVLANDDHVVLLSDRRARRDDRSVDMRAASIYHVRDGRIAEAWLMEWDPYAIDEFLAAER